jgi:hypothetical protein
VPWLLVNTNDSKLLRHSTIIRSSLNDPKRIIFVFGSYKNVLTRRLFLCRY